MARPNYLSSINLRSLKRRSTSAEDTTQFEGLGAALMWKQLWLSAAALTLACACTPEPFPEDLVESAEIASSAVPDTSTPAFWTINGSGSVTGSDVRTVSLGAEAQLFIRFKESLVTAGDHATVQAKVVSPAGRQLQIMLQRHCNPENGEDYERVTQNPSESPYAMEVSHVFGASYDCLRLTVFAPDKGPMDFQISNVKLALIRSTP